VSLANLRGWQTIGEFEQLKLKPHLLWHKINKILIKKERNLF
jgi:hypothetical protein